MKYPLEEKMFMYKKYMSLGSPTLVQREILVKNVKMPKYPRKSYIRKIFTIDQQSKPNS